MHISCMCISSCSYVLHLLQEHVLGLEGLSGGHSSGHTVQNQLLWELQSPGSRSGQNGAAAEGAAAPKGKSVSHLSRSQLCPHNFPRRMPRFLAENHRGFFLEASFMRLSFIVAVDEFSRCMTGAFKPIRSAQTLKPKPEITQDEGYTAETRSISQFEHTVTQKNPT